MRYKDRLIHLPTLTPPCTAGGILAALLAQEPGTFHAPSLSLLVRGRRLFCDSGAEVEVVGGKPLLLYGSTVAEAAEAAHPPPEARIRNDLALGGGAARASAPPPPLHQPFTGNPGYDGSKRYGFGKLVPLPGPDEAQSRAVLQGLATHRGVLAVMERRGWWVGELGELSFEEAARVRSGCLGYNQNRGERIMLLLRASREGGYRKGGASALGYDGGQLLDVLYHELAHIEEAGDSPHSQAFYALERQIKDEAQGVIASQGRGRVLGGARAAATFAGWSEPAAGGGGDRAGGGGAPAPAARVLGGDAGVQHALSPQEARRAAALRRAAEAAGREQQQQQQQQPPEEDPPSGT